MNLDPRTGLAARGNAGSGVLTERELFGPTAGFPAWLDANTLVYNSAGGQLWACRPDGSSNRFVAMQGGAPVLAGGGQWAIYSRQTGVVTSWGLKLPDAAPLTMAPDGTIFVTTYPEADGAIRAYRAGALDPAWTLFGANPMLNLGVTGGNARALDADRLVWIDTNLKIRARGFGDLQPAQCESAYEPTVIEPVPGVYWLAYRTQTGRNILAPFTRSDVGYVVTSGGFGFTGWSPTRGVLEVAWTLNEGETGEVFRRQFIAADPSDLETLPPPAPTVDPLPPMLCGAFFAYSDQYGADLPAPVGNCAVVVQESPSTDGEGAHAAARCPLPAIVDFAMLPFVRQPIALWQSGSTLDALAGRLALDRAKGPGLRRLAYLDVDVNSAQGWLALSGRPDWLPAGAIVGVQLYAPPDADPDGWGRSTLRSLERIRQTLGDGTPIVLIVEAYDRNGQARLSQVERLQPFWRLAATRINAAGLLFFAYARGGGMKDRPSLFNWFRAYAAAVPALPAWLTAPAPEPHPAPPPSPMPVPHPSPAPAPMPVPSPVSFDSGVILMTQISGVLHYFGKKDLGGGKAALYAKADHSVVFSAQGDTRPADQIGGWETFKVDGSVATASDGEFHTYVAIDVSGL